jgi:hypothetical protein
LDGQLEKYQAFLNNVACTKGKEYLLHNISKVILFKKCDEIESWKDLRPISVMPAWLMFIEKAANEVLKKLITEKLSKNQFGFKKGCSTNIAKLMVNYMASRNSYKKALLIDIEKAYDSVNREKLREKIKAVFTGEQARFIINLVEIQDQVTLEILGERVIPTKGLLQGSPIAPLLFNLYIDEAIENTK